MPVFGKALPLGAVEVVAVGANAHAQPEAGLY
jgi:hypothetical protein